MMQNMIPAIGYPIDNPGIMGVEGISAHEMYRETLGALRYYGDDVEVRGFKTKEILNFITVIREPWHHCHFVPGRRWNPWIAMSEALWIMAGRDDIAPLLPYNKRIAEYSDNGSTLFGAYGARLKFQIQPMLTQLKNDPSNRQAVLAIWNEMDLVTETKDKPCNDMLLFKLRKNQLHMTVINRSNDLHWGLYAVNIPTFGILMDWMAAYLGVEMGYQTHISNSLHIYTGGPGMKPNIDITKNMLYKAFDKLPAIPQHKRAFTEPVPLDTLVRACNDALGDSKYAGIPFIEFAKDFLRAYRRYTSHNNWAFIDNCRHAEDYQDWLMAAKVWIDD